MQSVGIFHGYEERLLLAGRVKNKWKAALAFAFHRSINANANARCLWLHYSIDPLWPNGAYQTRQSLDLCALSPDVLVLLSNLCSQGLDKWAFRDANVAVLVCHITLELLSMGVHGYRDSSSLNSWFL